MAVTGQEQFQKTAAAAVARTGALLRRLAPGKARRGARGLVTVVEVGLVCLVALFAARLFWSVFEPMPEIGAPAAPQARIVAPVRVGDPFRLAEAPEVAGGGPIETAATTLDLGLHGTWIEGETGSAVIRTPDGRQRSYFVGEEICCGATLERVLADEVIILRAGVREALRLPGRDGARRAANAPAAPWAQSPTDAQSPAQALQDIVRLEPASGGRLRLAPGPRADRFAALGLRAGDIVVEIGGRPAAADAASLAQTLQGAAASGRISLTIERDGARLPIEFSLADVAAGEQ